MSKRNSGKGGEQDRRLDKKGHEYLYRQLSDILRAEIRRGVYKEGSRLPSLNELRAQYKVNKITVLRALSELRNEGLIFSVAAQGTYVSAAPAPVQRPARQGALSIGLVSHVLYPGSFGPYHVDMIAGIQEEIGRAEASLVIVPAGPVEPQSRIYDLMMQANLDAVIYLGAFQPAPLRRMIADGPPAVVVDFRIEGLDVDTIAVDNRGGAAAAMDYLLDLGHRRLGMVLGPDDQVAARDRLAGARDVLKRRGIQPSSVPVASGLFERESGAKAMQTLLEARPRPTAVLCLNDEMAVGALQTIHGTTSLAVPQDISVMGFDDIPWARGAHPPLSTVQVDTLLIGRLAAQRLLDRLKNAGHTVTTTMISPRLMVRESTAPPGGES
ncbi:MAG: GntR family transcriptional regulator [Kiritimatiellae bacterium]|nr:GntR family transcriptional regulator [Kiritimatiellia bacterium]